MTTHSEVNTAHPEQINTSDKRHANGGLQLKNNSPLDNDDTLESSIMQALSARDNDQVNPAPQTQTHNKSVTQPIKTDPAIKGNLAVGNETPGEKRKQIKNLQDALSARDVEVETLQKKLQELIETKEREQPYTTTTKDVKLNWGEKGKAPLAMDLGSCTSDGKTAYFRPGGTKEIYSYTAQNIMEEWEKLPDHPKYYNFSLVTIQGVLTAVGGWHKASSSSALLSLRGKQDHRKWEEFYPPMPTARCLTAVACNGKTLVVAGGYEKGKPITTVELMDVVTKQWSITNYLPVPLYVISSTICEKNIYLVGMFSQAGIALGCSMSDLVKFSRPVQQKEAKLKRKWSQSELTPIWNEIQLPVAYTTCTAINDQLVAIGGLKQDGTFSNGAFLYNVEDNSWSLINHMLTARSRCLVTVVNGNTLVVAGGYADGKDTDVVEFANF